MSDLSVICCNVYPGRTPVEFLLRNMSVQTYKDFELVLVDACYSENAQVVRDLSLSLGISNVIHAPACEIKHIGRWLHWELYNNALLLANRKWVLYHGVYRYLHRRALEIIADCASRGISVVLSQVWTGSSESLSVDLDTVEYEHGMSAVPERWHSLQQSGFFSAPRAVMIDTFNGYNEACGQHHWVDVDLAARAKHISMSVEILQRAMLRLDRTGHYGMISENEVNSDPKYGPAVRVRSATGIGKSTCNSTENPRCIAWLLEGLRDVRRIDLDVHRCIHNGFEWVCCSTCGALGVEDSDAYIAHLGNASFVRAPVDICGVGRNLSILAEDMTGIGIQSKVDMLINSHTNPRYLQ